MDEIRILSPTAILGYGFPESLFDKRLSRNPHVIAVDAGSSDPGPCYLGAGVSLTDRTGVKRGVPDYSTGRGYSRHRGYHRVSWRSRRKNFRQLASLLTFGLQ